MAILTPTRRIPMSREQFEALPEGPPYYDYINGEAVEVNRPKGRHQQIGMRLGNVLWEFAQANDLGEVFPDIDVALPTGDTFGPDIVFLAKERLGLYDEEKGDLYGAPDLVVEILSPSSASYDRVEKFAVYHRAKVAWVWFVEQESLTIEEFQWTPEGYLLVGGASGGQVFQPKRFEGLEINLNRLLGGA